ncbi:hypothetical protein EDB19DRAFT_104906 [Suillus lakei]|nr:hypothetical protein EDB19DRAFT_104906 [Suillus lakei]
MGTAKGQVQAAGNPVGQGLSRQAAEELGLVEGMFRHRLAAVAGTSTCHLVQFSCELSSTLEQHDTALPFLRNIYALLFALLGGTDHKVVTSPLFLYLKVTSSPAFLPTANNITTSRHCCSRIFLAINYPGLVTSSLLDSEFG